MVEWNIQPRARACHACGESFADRQLYHTLLLDARGNYERLDVCERCWAAEYQRGAADRTGFVSHWQGQFETPAPRPEAIQKETAESVLRKLIARDQPEDLAVRFILAVMLERKRILKVREQFRHEGQRVFVYEHGATGDAFTIVDPELRLDQLENVQRDVARFLEQGTTQPEPEPAPQEPVPSPIPATSEADETVDFESPTAG